MNSDSRTAAPQVGRRIFFGSMVAGVPLLAGTALMAQRGAPPSHDHAAAAGDPVLDHLLRQMAATHNAAQLAPRAEHFRALGSHLRTLVVYERQIGMDDQLRKAARQFIDRNGRSAILTSAPDIAERRKRLESYGFRLPAQLVLPDIAASYTDREAALNALLARGITPTLDRMATMAERVAVRMDASPLRTVSAAQDPDYDWWVGYCAELWNQFTEAQAMAIPICVLAKHVGIFYAGCGAMEAGAAVLLLTYMVQCREYGH